MVQKLFFQWDSETANVLEERHEITLCKWSRFLLPRALFQLDLCAMLCHRSKFMGSGWTLRPTQQPVSSHPSSLEVWKYSVTAPPPVLLLLLFKIIRSFLINSYIRREGLAVSTQKCMTWSTREMHSAVNNIHSFKDTASAETLRWNSLNESYGLSLLFVISSFLPGSLFRCCIANIISDGCWWQHFQALFKSSNESIAPAKCVH